MNMKRTKAQFTKLSFTLVELLVVIAVICILAALMSPSLIKAVKSARMLSCGNGQKQYMQAMMMYSNDSNDWMPIGYYTKTYELGGKSYSFVSSFYFLYHCGYLPLTKVSICSELSAVTNKDITALTLSGIAYSSFGVLEWGKATLDTVTFPDTHLTKQYCQGIKVGVGYGISYWANYTSARSSASRHILIGDVLYEGSDGTINARPSAGHLVTKSATSVDAGCLSAMHMGRINVGYRDGHVKSVGVGGLLDGGIRRYRNENMLLEELQ